jgi:hypothetical protein
MGTDFDSVFCYNFVDLFVTRPRQMKVALALGSDRACYCTGRARMSTSMQ